MVLRGYLLLPLLAACSSAYQVSVASTGGNATSNLQYGAMFEEINHAGEGGIYAELVRNRAFQGSSFYPSSLDGWESVNGASLVLQNLNTPLSSALPTSVNVKGEGEIGLRNVGWWGIDVQPQQYRGSFYVKGDYKGQFTATLESAEDGHVWARAEIQSYSVSNEWVQHHYILQPYQEAPNVQNTLSITFDANNAEGGSLDFNLISLFPPTWNNRPNGMRIDIMQALAGMGPRFLRFPGGNNLEGNTIDTRWIWNQTIGPLKDRPGRPTTWGYEETGGLGLVEFMEWCDDLHMEPVLAVWDGHALDGANVPESELEPYIQEVLDELEFLMGDVTTKMGALRAKVGHPEPWNIRYVEVGNEDNLTGGLSTYTAYRFKAYYDAIKKKYPNIIVIASTIFMELIGDAAGDYHQYDVPNNFVAEFGKWDSYSDQHQILLGEIAATEFNNEANAINWSDPHFSLYPWWIGSVSEAVFLLGAERNSDKIIGATYAPGFKNLNNYEWAPTFISFTANIHNTSRSTSWEVYSLFNHHHITQTLPTTSPDNYGPLYWVAGENQDLNSHIFKAAVYNSTGDVPVSLSFEGVNEGTLAELTVLTAPSPFTMNVVGGPDLVQSKTTYLKAGATGTFTFSLPNLSVAVLETVNGRSWTA